MSLRVDQPWLHAPATQAVCAAVGLSLVVSVTVISTASSALLKPKVKRHGRLWTAVHNLFGLAPLFGWLVNKYSRLIHMLTFRSVSGVWARIVIIAVVMAVIVALFAPMNVPLMLALFAILSLIAWIGLRLVFRRQSSGARIVTRDINEN